MLCMPHPLALAFSSHYVGTLSPVVHVVKFVTFCTTVCPFRFEWMEGEPFPAIHGGSLAPVVDIAKFVTLYTTVCLVRFEWMKGEPFPTTHAGNLAPGVPIAEICRCVYYRVPCPVCVGGRGSFFGHSCRKFDIGCIHREFFLTCILPFVVSCLYAWGD